MIPFKASEASIPGAALAAWEPKRDKPKSEETSGARDSGASWAVQEAERTGGGRFRLGLLT